MIGKWRAERPREVQARWVLDVSDGDELLWGRIGDAGAVGRAFEDLPVGATVLEGPEHRFVAANAAYRAMVGRDIIGMPVREAFPELAGQQLFEAVDRIYASGEPYSMRGWRMHVTFDETGPQEIFLDVDFVPRRSADGTVQGILCTLRDATQEVRTRLAAQEQARVAERRFAQARDVIAALQRELLPHGLPVLPRVRIAGSYLLADADTAAGGDWFDALALPDGRVGLVVGDVVGHGVTASAVMGQLRAILAERLGAGAAIPDALAALDAAAGRIPGARAATVCVAALDPADGTLSYCTAGHPPPLLLPARGEPRFLPSTGAGPLGTGSAFGVEADRLDSHDMVLLYTDGLLERPGQAPSAATVELAQTAADVAAGKALRDEGEAVERVCTQTLELLVRATGHSDDITLLAAQRTPTVPDLHAEHPADAAAVPALRATLRGWLGDLGVSEDDGFALLHGIGELVANAVQHARPAAAAAATVALHAALSPDGVLHVEVRDQGRWRQRRGGAVPGGESRLSLPGRGRGLEMVRGLLDTLHVEPGPEGTTVRITHRLTWPARLLTTDEVHSGATPAPARRPDTTQLHVAEQPTSIGARLQLDGPLDAATALGLEIELQRRTRGGTRALTLDLTGVTHLASAGVAVLHTVKGLRFFAPAGSVAQQVLTLVALPHLTRDPDHADDTTLDGIPGWLDDTHSDKDHAGGHHIEDEVHQATGVVMAQLGLPAADALARLRAHSFAHHRPLLDIARDVIEGRLRFTEDMT